MDDSQPATESRKGKAVPSQAGSQRPTKIWSGRLELLIRYEVILYWSEDDQAFIAEVPELPGCAADGQSYQEALANAEDVIQQWIETAQELGRPIPEPKGRLMFA